MITNLSKITKALILSAPLLASVFIVGNSYAFQEPVVNNEVQQPIENIQLKKNKHHKKAKHHFNKMAKKLQLTDEQKMLMKAIHQQSKVDFENTHTEMKAFREQVKSLMEANIFDEQAFSAVYSQYQTTFEQAALLKAKKKHAISKILTVEQKEKWQKFNEKRGKLTH